MFTRSSIDNVASPSIVRVLENFGKFCCLGLLTLSSFVKTMSTEAPKVLAGANDHEKLQSLAQLTYKQQAVWFLNGFWDKAEKDAETLWKYVQTCSDLDMELHADGCGLDEVNAHRFLEVYNETLTVRELREKLRSTGALEPNERPKLVPLTHFLLFKYNVDWHKLVHASQGDNSAEIAEAQRLLNKVQAAFADADSKFREANTRAIAAQKSEAAAKAAEAEAVSKEEEARKQEAPFKKSQEEVEAALAEVNKQEAEYKGKIDDATKRSEEGGVVSRNKAKAELAQLNAEDPLPLQRAKITLEAAYKRAEKTRAPFEAATKQAEAARAAASAAANAATADRRSAESAKQAAEAALDDATRQVAEAEAYLNEIKNRPGCAFGALWWIDRELHEAKKFKPTSKGGIAK